MYNFAFLIRVSVIILDVYSINILVQMYITMIAYVLTCFTCCYKLRHVSVVLF